MSAEIIIQRINNAAKRLRASEKKLAADESQIASLRGLRAHDADMRSRLESKVKEDKRQISSLESQHALDTEQLEKNAKQIERLTESQQSISQKADKLKRDLDAKQKQLDSGYEQYELDMTGFKELEKKHKALQAEHATHLKDLERLKAQIKGLAAAESEAQKSALAANEIAKKWQQSNERTAEMHRSDTERYAQLSLEYNELVKSTAKKNYAISTREGELTRAKASIAALEEEVEERDKLVKTLNEEAREAKGKIRKLGSDARQKVLEHNKMLKDKDDTLNDKDAQITLLQTSVNRLLDRIGELKRKAEDTGKQLKDLKGKLNECLKHKERLEKKQSTLEATLKKSKTEQKALKEKLKTKTKESKTKSADKLRNRLDPNRDKAPLPKRPTKISKPQMRGRKVKKLYLSKKQIQERLAKLRGFSDERVKIRNDETMLQTKIAKIKQKLKEAEQQGSDANNTQEKRDEGKQDEQYLKKDLTMKTKELQSSKERLSSIPGVAEINKEINELEDLQVIENELDQIRKSIQNNKTEGQKWSEWKNGEGAKLQNFIQNLKSYEYNKRGRRKIDSPRLNELNEVLKKLTVETAGPFFKKFMGQKTFRKGDFERLLKEIEIVSPNTVKVEIDEGPAFQFSLRF